MYPELFENQKIIIPDIYRDGDIPTWDEAYKYVEMLSDEEYVTYEEIQNMSDEERKQIYEQITGEELDEVDDDFWDWVEEEVN